MSDLDLKIRMQHFTMVRILTLDSLRGIASFAVFVSHFAIFTRYDTIQKFPVADGSGAVFLFFILSAHVLATSRDSLRDFLVKRIFRIYPVYLFVFMCTAIVGLFVEEPRGTGVHMIWLNTSKVWPQLLFVPPLTLVPQAWTLVYELGLSMWLPFVLAGTPDVRHGVVIIVVFVVTALYTDFSIFEGVSMLASLLARRYLADVIKPLPWTLVAAVILATVPRLMRIVMEIPYVVIAVLLIPGQITIVHLVPRFRYTKIVLEIGPFVWLGEHSYCIYLMHMGVMEVFFAWKPDMAWPGAFVIILCVTLLLAALVRRVVEIPGMSLGRYVIASLPSARVEEEEEDIPLTLLHL